MLREGAVGMGEDMERKGVRLEKMLLELMVNCIAVEVVGLVKLGI